VRHQRKRVVGTVEPPIGRCKPQFGIGRLPVVAASTFPQTLDNLLSKNKRLLITTDTVKPSSDFKHHVDGLL
jgi:hypothetical protein